MPCGDDDDGGSTLDPPAVFLLAVFFFRPPFRLGCIVSVLVLSGVRRVTDNRDVGLYVCASTPPAQRLSVEITT